jgi:hypothetical protein
LKTPLLSGIFKPLKPKKYIIPYGTISKKPDIKSQGTSKNRLFSEVPLQFLALWATKRAFLSGKSLKTEVFRDSR